MSGYKVDLLLLLPDAQGQLCSFLSQVFLLETKDLVNWGDSFFL